MTPEIEDPLEEGIPFFEDPLPLKGERGVSLAWAKEWEEWNMYGGEG
jgi:hypothetical protein